MKNIFVHSKSQDQNLDELHTDHDSVLKRAMSEILLKADAMAIILIMLGGIVAVGKETRAFGIMLACAGFTMLLLRIGDHLADSTDNDLSNSLTDQEKYKDSRHLRNT